MLPSPSNSGTSAWASAFSEYALVWNAIPALSGGVVMKRPPSASSGAKAIACSAPSMPPQRCWRSAVSRSKCSGSFTSSSSTSGVRGSPFAERSVIRIGRPKLVRITSAPSFWARSATA